MKKSIIIFILVPLILTACWKNQETNMDKKIEQNQAIEKNNPNKVDYKKTVTFSINTPKNVIFDSSYKINSLIESHDLNPKDNTLVVNRNFDLIYIWKNKEIFFMAPVFKNDTKTEFNLESTTLWFVFLMGISTDDEKQGLAKKIISNPLFSKLESEIENNLKTDTDSPLNIDYNPQISELATKILKDAIKN